MPMKLIVVGSGTGIPMADRGSPCLLLIAVGEYTLFDLGPGSLRQLVRIGIAHDKIDRVFFSHFHPDHTADLVHFLFATMNPSVLENRRPFLLSGPTGLCKFLERLQRSYGKWLNVPPRILSVDELEIQKPDKRVFHGFTLFSHPLTHTANSVAYRVVDSAGASLVYSGDTGFSRELIEFARGADLLILECSFPDEDRVEHHLTPAMAGSIAAEAEAKKLLLVHFYPEVLASDIPEQCRRSYKGEIVLGRDFLHVDIG